MASPDNAPIARLRRLAAAAVERRGDDDLWFADRVAEYFTGALFGRTLDVVLGLSPAPGHDPWWVAERRLRRDAILRQIASRWFGAATSSARRAEEMARALRGYETSAWLRDRPFAEPLTATDPRHRDFHALLKLGAAPSARTIRRVLSGHEIRPFRGQPSGGRSLNVEQETQSPATS